MMQYRLLPIAALVLFAVGVSIAGEESPSEKLLADKGLVRKGSYYVLPAEEELHAKLRKVQPLRKKFAQAATLQQALEKRSQASKKLILAYTQRRRQLNQLLGRATTVAEHNRIVTEMNELTDRITLLYEGGQNPEQLRKVRGQVSSVRDQYLQLMLDLNNLATGTEKSYAELAADSAVQKAIEELGEKRRRKLGPTSTFRRNLKTLQRLQRDVRSEEIRVRREGEVFWVDTVINGKTAKAMIFDTGASLVTIPGKLAAELDMAPTEDDPAIDLQLADGRIVQGKLMTLASLRVGEFTVEKVTCAVLPPSLSKAEPLLGGSFLRNFTYKVDPDSEKLTLSRVEAQKRRGTSRGRK